ncbi:MAG: VWA domain-containing protein [Lachnospiraceae bacterium]|nr:VWA domain-containing protein [Lachnospiraceae bacterium]
MKKFVGVIILALILVLGLPSLAGVARAEEGNEGGVINQNGMTMSKYAHVQDDGTYIIDLEAFAYGEVTTTYSTTPCDIVLVLDVSGSMDEAIGSTYTYTARASQGYSYNSYGDSQYYYQHTDGEYYRVNRERPYEYVNWDYSRRYRLYYTVNNTRYYLSGTSVTTTAPTNVTGNNTTIWTGVLYERKQETKMDALKEAVGKFIDIVKDKNAAPEATEKSRVAIVKFAMNRYPWNSSNQSSASDANPGNYNANNGAYIGNNKLPQGSDYNYTQVVQDMTTVDATTATSMKTKVNAFDAGGATAADFGMALAQEILADNPIAAGSDRQQVVVMFTDGSPTYTNGFQSDVANSTIDYAKTMKGDGAKVFSVAVLQGADPTIDPVNGSYSSNTNRDVNRYLHGVSSNYPAATAITSLGTRYTDPETQKQPDFYFTASNSSQLAGIFAAIAHSTGGTSTDVGTEAILKDVVGSSFTLPPGATTEKIHVSIVRWNPYPGKHRWGTAEDNDGGEKYVFTPAEWATYTHNKYTTTVDGQTVDGTENVAISINGSDVDVTGFNYSKHFKATKAEEDNDAIDKPNGVNKDTAKVVISFEIDAKPSAVTGGLVATNGENSGLYVNGQLLIKFPQPTVVFTPVTYVVDYVTSDTSSDTKASSVKLDYKHVLDNVEMLDDPSDDILRGKEKIDFEYKIYKGTYGTISFGDDATDVERRYVRYAPTTMNWDGYDRIFIKGASATEDDKDVWAMLCVLPANSVFYEDTYITQTKTVTYNNQQFSIEYTGIDYDANWSMVGTEGKNQTQHVGDEMGWITGLADDSDYANDMAHAASPDAKAKATFTATGTGIDIYSRTNGSTGTITVTAKSIAADNVSNKKVVRTQIIDTKAAAGDFFAVPVCTFTDLPYGKYTVTITVSAAAGNEGRMSFYLDGVRVYNPIQPLEGDGNVQMMYGEKNMGAQFKEVRSLLGTNEATSEALYIDEHTITEVVEDLDAINEAARALAQAQLDRDAYVNSTITPAKNAVSAEAYALSKAESDLENATTVYNAAVEAYNAAVASGDAQAIADAQAVVNEKKADMDDAQDAYDAAVDHYDANIEDLQDALAAALAGRKTYDDAVKAAIAAYDEANTGVTVSYTEATVEQYDKEGPKTELYLSKGQQVAISVETGKTYYIGLRSLNGDAVTAQINGASVKIHGVESPISHTVDLYYEAVPVSGKIVIKNASDGDQILAVTKLRITNGVSTESNGGDQTSSNVDTMSFVRSLAGQPATEYTGKVLTEEEAAGAMLDAEDIAIENEEAAEVAAENETALSKILSSFFRFFSRQ